MPATPVSEEAPSPAALGTEPTRLPPIVTTFAVGRAAAVLGAQISSVTVGWVLYERTHRALSLGLVGVVELAPVLALMLPAGIAADRFPRRSIAMLAHGLHATAALGLALVAGGDPSKVRPEAIYALLVITGVARAIGAPAVGSLLPQLVPAAQLARANAVLSSSVELAAISGPAAGGLLVGLTHTARLAFCVAAVAQLAFCAVLSTVPAVAPPPKPPEGTKNPWKELFAGLAFLRRTPVFLAAITLDLFAVLLGGAVALLPVFARDVLKVGPSGLGFLRAAPSFGALCTALVLTRLRPWRRPGVALLCAVAGFGLATIGFGLSRSFALSLACLFLTGATDQISVVLRMTLEQVVTPDRLRGRVSAVNYVFVGFSNQLGAFESGTTAALVGPVLSVVGGGIGTLLVVLLVAVGWPALRNVGPLDTLRPEEDPA